MLNRNWQQEKLNHDIPKITEHGLDRQETSHQKRIADLKSIKGTLEATFHSGRYNGGDECVYHAMQRILDDRINGIDFDRLAELAE